MGKCVLTFVFNNNFLLWEGRIPHHHQEGNYCPDCRKQSPEWTQGFLEEDEDIHGEADIKHGQGEETPPATIIALSFPSFALYVYPHHRYSTKLKRTEPRNQARNCDTMTA